ncbi:Peropsin [Operophtera brumata]|uniref:Peropsin n=1 Tax=Operophtera brumata TaxID=104452 RepID=A0A0L7LGT7_OPEBR|nr:Peropsin [Operophtera brumata]
MTACAHRVVAIIPFANIGRLAEFHPYCNVFACMETFLAVLEVEWLTHVCIERYVIAKYVTNGWTINKSHYTLFKGLCAFFATLYSFLPVIGIGRYGFDFSCNFCTFDMILPDSWQRYYIVTIFFLRSIKPTAVM